MLALKPYWPPAKGLNRGTMKFTMMIVEFYGHHYQFLSFLIMFIGEETIIKSDKVIILVFNVNIA